MYLNDRPIEAVALLTDCFLPFSEVWRNAEIGLYQEFLVEYCVKDPLCGEILSAAEHLVSGADRAERTMIDAYSHYVHDNKALMGQLTAAAENGGEEQNDILYLCALMHIHAGHTHMTDETADFIKTLLSRRSSNVPVENPAVNKLCVVNGTACHLNAEGRIVSLTTGEPLNMAADFANIVSFAHTDKLGLIAVSADGTVRLKNAPSAILLPGGTKIIGVSAYLSNYILLSDTGSAYTNAVLKDAASWTNLRYVYAGLNSLCGIKRGGGAIVSAGCGTALGGFTDAARVCAYRDGTCRFIVLNRDGSARTDAGDTYADVTAIAISNDGYYFTSGCEVYRQTFDGTPIVCAETGGNVRELTVWNGKVFCL